MKTAHWFIFGLLSQVALANGVNRAGGDEFVRQFISDAKTGVERVESLLRNGSFEGEELEKLRKLPWERIKAHLEKINAKEEFFEWKDPNCAECAVQFEKVIRVFPKDHAYLEYEGKKYEVPYVHDLGTQVVEIGMKGVQQIKNSDIRQTLGLHEIIVLLGFPERAYQQTLSIALAFEKTAKEDEELARELMVDIIQFLKTTNRSIAPAVISTIKGLLESRDYLACKSHADLFMKIHARANRHRKSNKFDIFSDTATPGGMLDPACAQQIVGLNIGDQIPDCAKGIEKRPATTPSCSRTGDLFTSFLNDNVDLFEKPIPELYAIPKWILATRKLSADLDNTNFRASIVADTLTDRLFSDMLALQEEGRNSIKKSLDRIHQACTKGKIHRGLWLECGLTQMLSYVKTKNPKKYRELADRFNDLAKKALEEFDEQFPRN